MTIYANQFQSLPYFQRTFVSDYKYKYFFSSDNIFIEKDFLIMAKKVIRLTEADIEKLVQKVLSEQNESVLVNRLNEKIQSVMIEKQKEIFNGVKLVASKPDNNFIINISNKKLKLYPDETNKGRQGYLPNWTLNGKGEINIPSISLSTYYTDIWEGDDDLKRYYDENDYIKKQMDELLIPLNINFKIVKGLKVMIFPPNLKLKRKTKKYLKNHSDGNIGGLGDFYDNNLAYFQLGDVNYSIESSNWTVELGSVDILPPQPEPVQPTVIAPQTIKLDLVDVFKYDDIDIVNPTEYQTTLNNFKIKLNNAVTNIKGFKDHLNGKTLTVNGYASQDDNPAAKIGGKLPACSKYVKGPRSEYNKCLSQERAQKVADDLQTIFDELVGKGKIQVNAKGNGETHDFGGQGWDSEKKKTLDSEEELSKNRRVTFKVPPFTG